jgi:hypothetical protein
MHWMITRYEPSDPNTLVLAAKGGHNGEMHNQNDVGNLIVHWQGESLVADLGRGRYTGAYFGPERYEHLVNSSRGHSVPVVNGQLQQPGGEFASEVLEHRSPEGAKGGAPPPSPLPSAEERESSLGTDILVLELKGVYPPETDLASLRRTMTLDREPPHGSVSLEDVIRFASGPGTFESVLTTFAEVEVSDGVVLIRGERGALAVHYDPSVVSARLERIPDVDLAEGPTDVTRIVFALAAPAREATVRLRLQPVPSDG